jgi:16S rRNA processing protein RimM
MSEPVVILGRIAGLYGVRGWVKVLSHTEPRANILDYPQWLLGAPGGWVACAVAEGRAHGKGIVARLQGCEDRDAAARLVGQEIAVAEGALPELAPGEFYWSQLIGLEVVNLAGQSLGRVRALIETGAKDVLVVEGERERLIPYVRGTVIHEVAPAGGVIRVDWDADF